MTSLLDRINLGLRPISQLRPHEETLEGLIEELCESFAREGVQRDPVVVDKQSGTILDGTHRVEALRRMGAQSVLAYLVDYRDHGVRLRRWFRLVRSVDGHAAASILRELGLKRLQTIEGVGRSKKGIKRLVATYGGESFGSEPSSLVADMEVVRAFDRAVGRAGLGIEFVDEASWGCLTPKGRDLTLILPKFRKDDVLRAAADGILFPPKSTLHVLPFRPLGVRYPIKDLTTGKDVLSQLLKVRRPKIVERGISAKHARYREKIVEFL